MGRLGIVPVKRGLLDESSGAALRAVGAAVRYPHRATWRLFL